MKAGDKVHYTAPHGKKENGIIKSINESGDGAFVVYNCNEDWDNYENYTGAHTRLSTLTEGWIEQSSSLWLVPSGCEIKNK
jgi:hypothetical protein